MGDAEPQFQFWEEKDRKKKKRGESEGEMRHSIGQSALVTGMRIPSRRVVFGP